MGTKQQRLEQIRQHLGISKTQMAKLMGITPHYYYNILNGGGSSNLRLEHLEGLLTNADVNISWLLTGEGEMFVSNYDKYPKGDTPSSQQIEDLYQYTLKQRPDATLNSIQHLKLKLACARCFVDNPHLKTLDHLYAASSVYLTFILKFPDLEI